jgi:hypothetical protein
MLTLCAERASLKRARLYQYIAQPESRLLHNILEQYRLLALGRECADILDAHRFGDACHDIVVGFEITAQIFIERLLRLWRRSVRDAECGHS